MNRFDIKINDIRKESSYYELCKRCSRLVASGEVLYSNDVNRIATIEKNIFMDLWERRFLFNSPALFNLGIDMIVTDHHEPPEEIPSCIVVNPKRSIIEKLATKKRRTSKILF